MLFFGEPDGIEHHELGDGRGSEAFDGGARKDGVRAGRVNFRCALIDERLGALDDGARGIDHVVDEEALLAFDVADDVHDFHDVRLGAALIDDRHRAVEALCDLARTVNGADVGRDDDEVFVHLVFEVAVKERAAQKVIDGDIEEALDLRGVKVHREDAVGAGGS